MEKHNLNLEDFILDEIESIELIGEEETIDITVEDTHMFYANDIYTHNSAINANVVEGNMIGGSIKKGQIGHFILSVAKTLEQKESGRATLAILKSRFGKDGIIMEDILFDNGTLKIDTEDSSDVSFLNFEKSEEKKKSDTVIDALRKKEERMKSKN